MKQAYVLPNIITAFGLSCGLFVVFKVNLKAPGIGVYELLLSSTILILIAALADVLDGAIARVVKGESDFGIIFDSLADTVSFGVAPSVLLLKSLALEQGTWLSFFAFIAAMIYSICGILRLVRFNVKAAQNKGDELAAKAQKRSFTGLPIPGGAVCAISLNLFLNSPIMAEWIPNFNPLIKTIILCVGTLLVGLMMISRCRFFSLKALRFRGDSFYLLFATVIIAIFVLYGIIHRFSLVLFAISWGYLLLGCVLTLIKITTGKKSKTLRDFDPNSDEFE
ncbi:CDP-diacylglycerol--serine O-phosphatidyltransferase [Candidatus Aerophobetes bacterium]|uniref:CDP-diacylglycerol--serine O-phosphatidyltransferase n=1 Tax=Aerophobetes bacterium TaxID=2030807 RepID=A0A2A4YD31_UNCAE|nr:MAG: CDP-diacylglycerol--serine O-phosphatidyltransferase [Candidatus Aerophobetes bacterium]